MQKHMFRMLMIGSALSIVLAGCGAKDKAGTAQMGIQPPAKVSAAEGASTQTTEKQQAPSVSAQSTEKPAAQTQSHTAAIQTFFGNEDGTALITKQATISYSSDHDKYITALNALKKAPDSKTVALFEGFTFRKAVLEKGALHLDLSIDPKGNLGSNGEELMMQALKKALFQFPEVSAIYVTQDGKQVDSLMGHLDLPYPIKRK